MHSLGRNHFRAGIGIHHWGDTMKLDAGGKAWNNHLPVWFKGTMTCMTAVLFLSCGTGVGDNTGTEPITTVILVRHAEKASSPTDDPPLTPAGEARAQSLVRVVGESGISALYATQYLRTQKTVEPLAAHLGLSVTRVQSGEIAEFANRVLSEHSGQTLLISAHSNTVPQYVEAFGAESLCPGLNQLDESQECRIPEDQYDDLVIVTVSGNEAKALRLTYGEPSP